MHYLSHRKQQHHSFAPGTNYRSVIHTTYGNACGRESTSSRVTEITKSKHRALLLGIHPEHHTIYLSPCFLSRNFLTSSIGFLYSASVPLDGYPMAINLSVTSAIVEPSKLPYYVHHLGLGHTGSATLFFKQKQNNVAVYEMPFSCRRISTIHSTTVLLFCIPSRHDTYKRGPSRRLYHDNVSSSLRRVTVSAL